MSEKLTASKTNYKEHVKELLKPAGIKLNGPNRWDIQVVDEGFYKRALAYGSLGLGESYMDGWWTSKNLEETIARLITADVESHVKRHPKIIAQAAKARIFNLQNVSRAYKNAQSHYDIGNDLYEPMLGKTMAYTCAYWKDAKTLDDAQEAKYDLVCRKLGLKKGMRVLDIGCGWGGLAMYMATKYKAEVTCFTPAKEQVAYIKQHAKGLNVKVQLSDYREFKSSKKFDRIAAIGVTEHIGPKNYKTFMAKVDSLLMDDGLFVLHTIGSNKSTAMLEPWINKYIFPGGVLPSVAQLATAAEGVFIIEDLHNIGPYYEKTLLAWYKNFVAAWPTLEDKYGERFYRMWEFYLLACAANFKVRGIQLWQIVLSKPGKRGLWEPVR